MAYNILYGVCMRNLSISLFLFFVFSLFNLSAQNVPNQKRAVGTVNLEVISFNADSTYEKVKKQLDAWELKYDDADLFYKTELIFKNSYFKGMALSKVVIGFDLKTKYITRVEITALENSKAALDAFIAELAKKYPLEKAYDQLTAKNGYIKQKGLTITFYFDKRPVEKKEEPKEQAK